MARNGVTREQVVKAAKQLQAEGKPVTVTAVRSLLGETGSYTTISSHLKAWREQSGVVASLPKDLERSVLSLLGRLWRALAVVGVEAQQKSESRMGDLESEVRSCEADLHQLREEQAAGKQQVAALRAELEHNEKLLASVEEELAAIHREQRCLQEKEEALARRLDELGK